MRIVVTGGTGFVGRALCPKLAAAGHRLRVPTRSPEKARPRLPAETEVLPLPSTPNGWRDVVAGSDAIVNLAGEPIAGGRWTAEQKEILRKSRIDTTRGLVEGCAATTERPRVLISASAIGYYGPRGDEPLDETAPPGEGFLASICTAWEVEASRAETLGLRVVRVRIGVVLGEGGGALARMVTPFKLFVGGPLGDGKQWMSWIHLDDLIGLIEFALDRDTLRGPMNATAPDPRTMKDFSAALGAALGRPSWAPVPAVVLKLALGEMAEMLLTGQRVLPAVAERERYAFRFPRLEAALADILR